MTYHYQFLFLLLAAGHIYCSQKFTLKNGNILEILRTKTNVEDVALNGTHIKKSLSYNVAGLTKTNDTQENLNWSTNILSVSELELKDRHHNVKNCNVYLDPPYLKVSEDMFEVLQDFIKNDICKNSTTIDETTIDLYEDKDNYLKNLVISQSKYTQARDGLDTVFDAALLLARKKLGINDFIDSPSMSLGGLEYIKDVTIGNFSTISRAESVLLSNNSNVLSINVLLNIDVELTFTFTLPMEARIRAHAPRTVAGATIKLDYSKEKCQTVVDDVELDFNNSLRVDFLNAWINLMLLPSTTFFELALRPGLLKPQMKAYLDNIINKHVNCEDLRPINRW